MKSFKCLLILIILYIAVSQNTEAQKYRYYNFSDAYNPVYYNLDYYNITRSLVMEKHIQSEIVTEEYYKKDKPVHQKVRTIKKYDHRGNNIEYIWCNNRGKIRYRTITAYDTSNNKTEQIFFVKKRQTDNTRAKYNQFGKCTEYAHFNKKGKLKREIVYNWDSILLMEALSYKKGDKLSKKWVYEYYPDKITKKIIKYNSKGKIKKVWTYDCSLLGNEMKKHEDTIKMCRFDSFDRQGYYYKIQKTSMENGKLDKTVYKYSKDSLYLGYSGYDEKNRLKYFSDMSYSGDTIISIYKSFSKKGKLRQNSLYKQDKQHNTFYSENCWKAKKCNKKKYVSDYQYNQNRILLKVSIYRGACISYTKSFFYTFY